MSSCGPDYVSISKDYYSSKVNVNFNIELQNNEMFWELPLEYLHC